jgi:hypothetical protein
MINLAIYERDSSFETTQWWKNFVETITPTTDFHAKLHDFRAIITIANYETVLQFEDDQMAEIFLLTYS